ncbi:MAG: hypothetical protein QOF12_708 [Solirubrobacteraceae bacterium]|nr:hypothetical protein [Solirubrobacteraceae bacterium]
MPIRLTGLLCGGLLLITGTTAASAVAAVPIKAQIRVEGTAKTLVATRTVELADAPIIKDGNPAHSCAGQTALGALQAGTGGNWTGTWYEGLGYSADTIKGFKPAGSDYFELWVDHKLSQVGLCGANLKASDSVLLFVQHCTYDPTIQACPHPETPLGIRAPSTLRKGKVGTLRVVDYDAQGKTTPEPGATIYANGKRLGRTDKHGVFLFKGRTKGVAKVYASKTGFARSEVADLRIR